MGGQPIPNLLTNASDFLVGSKNTPACSEGKCWIARILVFEVDFESDKRSRGRPSLGYTEKGLSN